MVKAPTCKVCGSSHWSGAGHSWPDAKASPGPCAECAKLTAKLREASATVDECCDELGQIGELLGIEGSMDLFPAVMDAIKALQATPAPKISQPASTDRAAYMRAYRAKRAKT